MKLLVLINPDLADLIPLLSIFSLIAFFSFFGRVLCLVQSPNRWTTSEVPLLLFYIYHFYSTYLTASQLSVYTSSSSIRWWVH